MEKHNPEQLTAPAGMAGQAAQQKRNQRQGPAGAQNQVENGGSSRTAGAGDGAVGRNQQGQSQRNYPQTETISCPFDLHQYKTVSASDIHYKPVAVENITSSKDLYLTVSTSTIQVEHLNSWRWWWRINEIKKWKKDNQIIKAILWHQTIGMQNALREDWCRADDTVTLYSLLEATFYHLFLTAWFVLLVFIGPHWIGGARKIQSITVMVLWRAWGSKGSALYYCLINLCYCLSAGLPLLLKLAI